MEGDHDGMGILLFWSVEFLFYFFIFRFALLLTWERGEMESSLCVYVYVDYVAYGVVSIRSCRSLWSVGPVP